VIRAERYFSVDDDGLARRPWIGRVFLNPPYSATLIPKFVAKLLREFRAGNVTEAVVLVNNATETAWYTALAETASLVCFPRGRVKFWHPDKTCAAPLQGQAVLYLGPNPDSFRRHFERFGTIADLGAYTSDDDEAER